MNPERFQRMESLFHQAIDLPADERPGFLAAACNGDEDLRRDVEGLLTPSREQASMLNRPAWETDANGSILTVARIEGQQLGPYKIEARIGAGGMGEVFRAVDSRLNRQVAIKICSGTFGDRFHREARAISTLNHPHICTLYDVGPNYLVMELLEGCTLAAEIKKGPLALEQVARYGAQIAEALAEAHARGMVHRDLKPGNIMITRHGVKVLDFGLAKMATDSEITGIDVIVGTPGYMAPEQVRGWEADARTDLFALGLVLYEMAAGKPPLPGQSLGRLLASGAHATVLPPSRERPAIPARLDKLIAKLLEKDPARRQQSAAEVASELTALADQISAPPSRAMRPAFFVPAAVLMLLLIVGGIWAYRRSENRRWAREDAIPEINRLVSAGQPLAGFLVLRKAQQALPGNPELAQIEQTGTRLTSVQSTPPGAAVEIQDYNSPKAAWLKLGTTPLKDVRIPNGYFRWRVSKPGAGEFIAAPSTTASMRFHLDAPGVVQAGMVHIDGGSIADMIGFIGWLRYQLPAFDMDKFEVTNQEYQKFVDQGGYQKKEYWKERFFRDGKELPWEQAMALLRDPTGRPGPSTWEAGHFPPGQADYPVSGVSWYEASAYAAFAGKSLPALGQWLKAAPVYLARPTIGQSNFGLSGPLPVGASQAVGPYGTYDLIGNAREWVMNSVDGDRRFILGGAWSTPNYLAFDPEALLLFDRSPLNGFRCVRNLEPLPASVAAPIVRTLRDFSKAKPASDELFKGYQAMYAYEHRPLNEKAEGVVEDTADWTKEKITIDAGYGTQRLTTYLFLPKNVHPPYQTVLFFPSARVAFLSDSRKLGDMQFVDYVIKSGRALLYPIYQGTYERMGKGNALAGSAGMRESITQQSKEVRRAIDYLATRPDIDMNKLAYMGVSAGTASGVIFATLEDRFKAVVFLDGGFFLCCASPGTDQVDFAPRLKKPVLMVNGRYDFTFPPDQSQLPLFQMLGTPERDKRRVVFDTPHDVSQKKPELTKEVLAWLDQYLGRVN